MKRTEISVLSRSCTSLIQFLWSVVGQKMSIINVAFPVPRSKKTRHSSSLLISFYKETRMKHTGHGRLSSSSWAPACNHPFSLLLPWVKIRKVVKSSSLPSLQALHNLQQKSETFQNSPSPDLVRHSACGKMTRW